MDVILIAAVTANGMIARSESDVVDWSEDLSLFREQTMGQTVVMGSRTARTLATTLDGRTVIVAHRGDLPEKVLRRVRTEKCFVIGGARTYSRFAPFLTHLYLTIHPLVFPSTALPLFFDLRQEIRLLYVGQVAVNTRRGIFQFQYAVERRERL